MNGTLEKIVVERIELKQYRLSLYQLRVYTKDRNNCYACGRSERREKDGKIKRIDLFDCMNRASIITTKLTAIEVVHAAKIIKEYFDDINSKNERINAIANSRKKMLKIAIAVIFAKRVDD